MEIQLKLFVMKNQMRNVKRNEYGIFNYPEFRQQVVILYEVSLSKSILSFFVLKTSLVEGNDFPY
jgi:hypothetical protein